MAKADSLTAEIKTPEPVKEIEKVAKKTIEKKRVRNYRSIVFQGYLILAIAIFSILAELARLFPYFPVDLTITKGIQSITSPVFSGLMIFISSIGYFPLAIIIFGSLLAGLYLTGLHWEALAALISIMVSETLVGILKVLVGRARPPGNLIHVSKIINGGDFPSGHVVSYVVFFGFYWYLVYVLVKRSSVKIILLLLLSVVILLVGPSRIFLGEHWASDVFGAYILGSALLLLAIYFYKWGKERFFTKQPVAKPSI